MTIKPLSKIGWIILMVMLILYLLPRLDSWNYQIGSRAVVISDPLQEWPVYIWGNKFKLRPDYRVSLVFQSGFEHVLALNFPSEESFASIGENIIRDDQEALHHRLSDYYQTEISYDTTTIDNRPYQLIESVHNFKQEELPLFLTVPAQLSFFIQKNDISQEQMVAADSMLDNFRQLEISNQNLMAVKPFLDYQSQSPVLGIYLDKTARSTLFREMRANRDKLLTVMIDDQITLLSPIGEPVTNGRLTIAGGRSLAQAKQLALMLMSPFEKLSFSYEDNARLLKQVKDNVVLENSARFLPVILISYVSVVILLCGVSVVASDKIYPQFGRWVGFTHVFFIIIHLIAIRLMERIISPALLMAMIITLSWWLVLGLIALKQLGCLEKKDQRLIVVNYSRVFGAKNKLIRNAVSVMIISSLIMTAFARSKYLPSSWSSSDFAQEMTIFSVSSCFYYFGLMKWLKKIISGY